MKLNFKDISLTLMVIGFMVLIAANPPVIWQPPHHDNTMTGVGTDDEPLGVNTDTIHLAPVYSARLNQATTAAPTALVFNNNYTGTAPVWTRDSIGTYKLTKAEAFIDSTFVVHFTVGSGTAFVGKAYRATDSTMILRLQSKLGIGADLGGTGYFEIWRYIE